MATILFDIMHQIPEDLSYCHQEIPGLLRSRNIPCSTSIGRYEPTTANIRCFLVHIHQTHSIYYYGNQLFDLFFRWNFC